MIRHRSGTTFSRPFILLISLGLWNAAFGQTVATSGAAATATYSGLDTTTQGLWTGHYGADGQIIANGAQNVPAYAAVTLTGDYEYTWAATSSDLRAPQISANSGTRTAAQYYGVTSFTIDLNITDGGSHLISLYLLDWDEVGRTQSISIVDATSGTVLDTRNYSSFINGQYASWTITGHVQIKVANTGPANSTISGLFFGAGGTVTPSSSATYNGLDTTTQGTWTGHYGGDGQMIANGAQSIPSYAAVNLTGDYEYTWAPTTGDLRAPQIAANSATRSAAQYFGVTSFSIDLNLTDGGSHLISLYLLDWDYVGRTETISIVDAVSGAVLNTQNYASFSGGQYASWTIKGHVVIHVNNTGAANATISALLFGAGGTVTPSSTATYNGLDTTTQGLWTGHYGGDGQMIANGAQSVPSYAAITSSGEYEYTWAGTTTDARGLQNAASSTTRTAAQYYGVSTFTFDLNLTDGGSHLISLYLLDWDYVGRTETISIVDAVSGAVLDTRNYASFSGGQYASWTIKGHVVIHINNTGPANATISALLFGAGATVTPTSTASYNGLDTTTQGTWTGHYGADGRIIAGGTQSIPSYASVAIAGDYSYTWAGSTSDQRALQTAASSTTRVAAQDYATSFFTIDLNLTDGGSHIISLYLLDWDSVGRTQSVSIVDAVTGTVLDTRNYSAFSGGQWGSWTIKGHVVIHVNNTGPANATMSGLFFDTQASSGPLPTITSFTPTSGPAGSVITVTGTNLSAIASGQINSAQDVGILNVSATSVIITVPADASTGLITLTNNAGSSGSSSSNFVVTTQAAVATPMPIISRNIPVYADNSAQYEPPAYATDNDYSTNWVAASLPDALYFDLSSVPVAQRSKIDFVWYNDGTYDYDQSQVGTPLGSQTTYGLPGAYTIEVNAAPGGTGAPPTSGWIVVTTVTNNVLQSREHVVPFAGYNWIRMNIGAIAANSAAPNEPAINVDIYDASNGVTDGWFFGGDSITANTMGHANFYNPTVVAASFGNQVNSSDPPIQENGGMAGFTSGQYEAQLARYLQNFPGKFVTLSLGTNDADNPATTAQFYTNMSAMVQMVIAAGKVPVVPTVPWTCEASRVPNMPTILGAIQQLYAAYPAIVKGPDLYGFFSQPANQQYIKGNDCLHPTSQGSALYRQNWAKVAATLENASGPTVSLTANPTSISTGASSTLIWNSTNTTSCTASGGWSGAQPTSGSTDVSPSATTTYALSCSGPSGSAQSSATVTVGASSGLPYWVYVNGVSTVSADWSWSSTINYAATAGGPLSGASDIEVDTQQWGGWQPYLGSINLAPYTNFTLAIKPTVANQVFTLSFTVTGASSSAAVINPLTYGPAPVVGQWGVYTIPLTALGVSGQSVQNFALQDQTGLTSNKFYVDNVGFLPAGATASSLPPTVTLSSNPVLVALGGTSTLTWSSANASNCSASSGWNGALATSGSKVISPAATDGYAITCSSAWGTATASAGVTVTKPGTFAVQTAGNKFVDGNGDTIQMRGVNLSGLEFTAVGGWDPQDPTGGQFGQPNNPNWSAIQNNWKASIVRIPLNEDSWLGLTCTDTGNSTRSADPGNNYKQTVENLVQEANSANLYVILDLHWAAPGNSCPMLQSQMADADHSLAFWSSIANTFKNNPSVMFELFNEPFLDTDFTGDPWQYMMFGTGGAFSGYPATGNSGVQENISTPWNVASYQAMINAVRATGATNVVLIGSVSYTADLSGWLAHKPYDPLNQMAATWHAYPTFGAAFGSAAYAQPNYSPEIFSEVLAIQASGVPVIITETGDHDVAGTVGAPLVQTVTQFADANGLSILGWTWDVWDNADDVLIKDVNGTPTDGYGVFFQNWLVKHP